MSTTRSAHGYARPAARGLRLQLARGLRHERLRRVDPDLLRLVAVTDEPGTNVDGWIARVGSAVRGGATMVQVRAKKTDPRTLLELVKRLVIELPVPVVVNDRADIAIMAGASGVHVGVADIPVESIRAFSPRGFLIGASVGSRAEVEAARGADYIGIGPAFLTESKSDAGPPLPFSEISELQRLTGLPAVAIGGITAQNAAEVLEECPTLAGVAAVSSLFGTDDVESAAGLLRGAIGR